MAIRCPCGTRVGTGALAPGKRVKCPICERVLMVPGEAEPAAKRSRPPKLKRRRDDVPDPMDELPPDVAEVVRAGKRFCRLCWCNLDAGAEFCHHCGTEVKPVSPADVREAERAVKKLASLRNRAIFMPLLAVSLALALGPVMQSFGEASIYLFRAYIYVCVGLAATFSGLWGLGEFLNQDSKLRQNRVLRQRLRRLNLLTLLANGLSFVLVIVVGVVSVLLTLKLNR